jgi:serine/threonine protein kinase
VVAIKRIQIEHADEGIPSTALREISLLRELDHPNIVKLIDVVMEMNVGKMSLVFEYVKEDVKKFLDKRGKPFSITETKKIMW